MDTEGQAGGGSGSSATSLLQALVSLSLGRAVRLLSHQDLGFWWWSLVDRLWSLDHVNPWSLHQGPPFESSPNYFLGCISHQVSVSKTSGWAKICSAAYRLYMQREFVCSISSSAMATDHGAALWELTQTHPASSHGGPPGAQNLPGRVFVNSQVEKRAGPPVVRVGG